MFLVDITILGPSTFLRKPKWMQSHEVLRKEHFYPKCLQVFQVAFQRTFSACSSKSRWNSAAPGWVSTPWKQASCSPRGMLKHSIQIACRAHALSVPTVRSVPMVVWVTWCASCTSAWQPWSLGSPSQGPSILSRHKCDAARSESPPPTELEPEALAPRAAAASPPTAYPSTCSQKPFPQRKPCGGFPARLAGSCKSRTAFLERSSSVRGIHEWQTAPRQNYRSTRRRLRPRASRCLKKTVWSHLAGQLGKSNLGKNQYRLCRRRLKINRCFENL